MEYEHKMECFAVPVTKDDLAKILNVSYVTVDRLVMDGAIDYLKVRGSVRFTRKNIEDYIASATRSKKTQMAAKNSNAL